VGVGARVAHNSSAHFEVQSVDFQPWGTTASLSIDTYSPQELQHAWQTIKEHPDRGKYETAILSPYR
jgi:hypothetical protein